MAGNGLRTPTNWNKNNSKRSVCVFALSRWNLKSRSLIINNLSLHIHIYLAHPYSKPTTRNILNHTKSHHIFVCFRNLYRIYTTIPFHYTRRIFLTEYFNINPFYVRNIWTKLLSESSEYIYIGGVCKFIVLSVKSTYNTQPQLHTNTYTHFEQPHKCGRFFEVRIIYILILLCIKDSIVSAKVCLSLGLSLSSE